MAVTIRGSGQIVVQVVAAQITTATTVSIASAGTFYDISGFTATITPVSASNKILVLCNIVCGQNTTGGNRNYIRLLRNSTAISIGDAAGTRYLATAELYVNDSNGITNSNVQWLDSPATTSAVTYKFQTTSNVGGETCTFNRAGSGDTQPDGARAASQILLLEVAYV
jgi:hypothetical protein